MSICYKFRTEQEVKLKWACLHQIYTRSTLSHAHQGVKCIKRFIVERECSGVWLSTIISELYIGWTKGQLYWKLHVCLWLNITQQFKKRNEKTTPSNILKALSRHEYTISVRQHGLSNFQQLECFHIGEHTVSLNIFYSLKKRMSIL
jgi:hypothetical protein